MDISAFLNFVFSPSVVESMGDWYGCVYSWSVFAVVCFLCLSALCCLYGITKAFLGWLR